MHKWSITSRNNIYRVTPWQFPTSENKTCTKLPEEEVVITKVLCAKYMSSNWLFRVPLVGLSNSDFQLLFWFGDRRVAYYFVASERVWDTDQIPLLFKIQCFLQRDTNQDIQSTWPVLGFCEALFQVRHLVTWFNSLPSKIRSNICWPLFLGSYLKSFGNTKYE